ncbi:MAG TPA: cobalamin-binding protein [Candidatus Acidoferrales bacterium]|nr:cobalamin-binding protein [Candidatus Acidoferrales bacterium]
MRICSLLPSATEIAYAIGLGDSILGVSHECDFPAEAATKPALLRPRVDPAAPPVEIDRLVSEIIARGESIYAVDVELLASLSPDLILTQDLCHVCAASPDDLAAALTRFPRQPQVLSLTPRSLDEVWGDIRRVGEATGRRGKAEALATALEQRVAEIAEITSRAGSRPRVLCLEWLDPYYVGGHWVPEMVDKAGGEDVLGSLRQPSFRVTADEILQSRPDVIVVMPCGYGLVRARTECDAALFPEGWKGLPAVRESRIFAVDANSYFSRPGPRLADGVALLAYLLHPDLFPSKFPANAHHRR